MNNSNNIFGGNLTQNTPHPDNTNGVNQTPKTNNPVNNVNPTENVNNVFGGNLAQNTPHPDNINGVNPTLITPQNEAPQVNQSVSAVQTQNDFNTQSNNTMPTSNINQTSVNPIPIDNANVQSTIQPNQNINNIPPQQNFTTINQVNDDELLKAFIGNNYEKITTRPFNFAGCFFTTLYMFYRKMFVYALLVFLLNLVVLNIINNFVVTIAFCVVVGLLVNKIYLSYAKKKIAVIKANNPQKSTEELKTICATKGGTSVGKIFLGFFTELCIALVILFIMALVGIGGAIGGLFNPDNWNITVNDGSGTSDSSSTKDGTLLENVSVGGHSCMNSKCSVTIKDASGNREAYVLGISNSDFFNKLGNYKDYIKIDIYYNKNGNNKTIVNYKIYLKSSNEDISNVSTENELRDKIGLYSIGTHTESLTLKEIGATGAGFSNDKSYTYTNYTFVDSKNNEYEMKYINNNGTLNLTEGQKYNVTFEVSEGTFDYEFTIKSIN